MKKIDWDKLSLVEIRQIQADARLAEKSAIARDRKQARAAAEAAAAEYGYTLSELIPVKSAKTRAKAPPKYAHPENPSKTWSGNGRQPAWIKEHVEAGKSLDDLLIGS